MNDDDWQAEQFEASRDQLRAVAYRMLGSLSEADDAVQEAWLRLNRSDTSEVRNLRGWLTTVVGRICLDMLRTRRSRREEPLDLRAEARAQQAGIDPQDEALLAESVSLALLVVLDSLGPAERVAFVMHDVFAVPYEEIGPIVGRSSSAARMLASRARRRVQDRSVVPDTRQTRQRKVLDAFLAASRDGDFEGLLAVLDPDVEVHAVDEAVDVPAGAARYLRGARKVAGQALLFAEVSRFAQICLVDGGLGAIVAPGGRPSTVLTFRIEGERIARIDVIADPSQLRRLDIGLLTD